MDVSYGFASLVCSLFPTHSSKLIYSNLSSHKSRLKLTLNGTLIFVNRIALGYKRRGIWQTVHTNLKYIYTHSNGEDAQVKREKLLCKLQKLTEPT